MLEYKLTEEQYNDWIKNGTTLPPLDESHLQPIPKKRLRHLYTTTSKPRASRTHEQPTNG